MLKSKKFLKCRFCFEQHIECSDGGVKSTSGEVGQWGKGSSYRMVISSRCRNDDIKFLIYLNHDPLMYE